MEKGYRRFSSTFGLLLCWRTEKQSKVEILSTNYQATIVIFMNNTQWFGFFDNATENPADETKNYWSFVKFNNSKIKTPLNGDDVINIEIKDKIN